MLKVLALAGVVAFAAAADISSAIAKDFNYENEGWYGGFAYHNASLFHSGELDRVNEEKVTLGEHVLSFTIGKHVYSNPDFDLGIEVILDYHPKDTRCTVGIPISHIVEEVGPGAPWKPSYRQCATTSALTPWVGLKSAYRINDSVSFIGGGGLGIPFVSDQLKFSRGSMLLNEISRDTSDFAFMLQGGVEVEVDDSTILGTKLRHAQYGAEVEPQTSFIATLNLLF